MKKENDQKYLKIISKVLYILAKIAKICLTIAIPCLLIGMVFLNVVTSRLDYHGNSIYYQNEDIIQIDPELNTVHFKNIVTNDKIIDFKFNGKDDEEAVLKLKGILDKHSMKKVVLYVNLLLLFGCGALFLTRMVFEKLEKLFKNIHDLDTPFTDENTLYLKKIGYFLVILAIFTIVSRLVLYCIINSDVFISFDLANIFEILIVFGLYYIFKYGTKMQARSKMRIYENNATESDKTN